MKQLNLKCPKCSHAFQSQDFLAIGAAPMFHVTCRKCYADAPVNFRRYLVGGLLFLLVVLAGMSTSMALIAKIKISNAIAGFAGSALILLWVYVGFKVYVKFLVKIISTKGWG